ncbi:MAG: ATP-grasp domain-containing protein [Clostridiales Family XIII bacterium]|jgi:biotin carboxylase|nr:ATP-grasp domain-containing protein [Clostridiales Family XIII bacterium]
MINLKGKKLLVLGGGYATYDLVRLAKSEGVYTVVADYLTTGDAKEIADEAVLVSTTDMDSLLSLIDDKQIDGVFCGPSEFNLRNAMRLCDLAGLPFYCTPEQWDMCSDKVSFKKLCRKHGVPCIPEFHVTRDFLAEDLDKIVYPVMVKPVDGSSARGMTVCHNHDELKEAYDYALSFSVSKSVLVEKFIMIESGICPGYIVHDGELYIYRIHSRYMVDSESDDGLFINFALFPSERTTEYISEFETSIKAMLKEINMNNGVLHVQGLIDKNDGNLYFHEMGLRLGGMFSSRILEPTTGINDTRMMLRGALGESIIDDEEIGKINLFLNGKVGGILCTPLKSGTIGTISGLDDIFTQYPKINLLQYYKVGSTITKEKLGSLDQLFGRFYIISDDMRQLKEAINFIHSKLKILDTSGNDMIFMRFDVNRIKDSFSGN